MSVPEEQTDDKVQTEQHRHFGHLRWEKNKSKCKCSLHALVFCVAGLRALQLNIATVYEHQEYARRPSCRAPDMQKLRELSNVVFPMQMTERAKEAQNALDDRFVGKHLLKDNNGAIEMLDGFITVRRNSFSFRSSKREPEIFPFNFRRDGMHHFKLNG